MTNNLRYIHLVALLCLAVVTASAQRFYNLTSAEVRVDSVVPMFCHTENLPPQSIDSTYTFAIVYPEYVEMPRADVDNYRRLSAALPPATPRVETRVVMDRKHPSLAVSFCPVVYRDGQYQVLASFMLRRQAIAKGGAVRARRASEPAPSPADRYASHSVLRSGKWAKIRVPQTGIYQLTAAVARKAGFTDLSKVKIYGYGGNLQNEVLNADDLVSCDDLHELPTCNIGGRRLFYGRGPVSWNSNEASRRTRNPYSDYGYYFLTESSDAPTYADSAAFVASFYPSAEWCHSLYEVDGYSYLQGGRNLFDSREVRVGDSLVVTFSGVPANSTAMLNVNISSADRTLVDVLFNGENIGSVSNSSNHSDAVRGFQKAASYRVVTSAEAEQRLVFRVTGNGPMRLDYADLSYYPFFRPLPDLATAQFPEPEYVYNITNQDHHADPQADMVIIIPTSQKLLAQAERLKAFHAKRSGMRVNIVPADELFNEFSSGTPDASAYRHYMKMLYDRAATEADQPKFLLMFGGSVWDNRMNTPECRLFSADDYLLAYESEESFDKRTCCVDDGFYATLDDGEGASLLKNDKMDVAVGRFPVTTESDAKTMVDKAIAYMANSNGGSWLNTIFFMGDDGDNNEHMTNANQVADQVLAAHPGYLVKKVMWDAYQRESTASGYTYPEVEKAIRQQQAKGALIMDYTGHGSEWQFSHENVLHISDFDEFSNANLPLWATFGCDFAPYDRLSDNIGMKAVLNAKGGAVAAISTTRTVYSNYNYRIHSAFMRHVLSYDADGSPVAVGEALRRAKNDASTNEYAINSRDYVLLGDPAMPLNLPTATVVIDSIGGVDVASGVSDVQLKAGTSVRVKGHIENMPGFEGDLSVLVRDNSETVTCRHNATDKDYSTFTYTDRTKTIYNGVNRVSGGEFAFTFAVPLDINYSNESGLITAWAIADDRSVMAQGYCDNFTVGGSEIAANDSIGPSIYCYLKSPSFQNGGSVNSTPYFVAELTDRDGINASGAGIGHDMQLVVDGKQSMTYSLNDNFMFDMGSYTSGSTYYILPELSEGEHTLQFRAWDIQNNVSTAQLRFRVVRGQSPSVSLSCTDNPASTSTTFIVTHDRMGSTIDVTVELFDLGGRMLWSNRETGVSSSGPYTLTWNLTLANGSRLEPGVYLYRVKLTSDGATRTTKAKKLVVTGNK